MRDGSVRKRKYIAPSNSIEFSTWLGEKKGFYDHNLVVSELSPEVHSDSQRHHKHCHVWFGTRMDPAAMMEELDCEPFRNTNKNERHVETPHSGLLLFSPNNHNDPRRTAWNKPGMATHFDDMLSGLSTDVRWCNVGTFDV